MLTFIYLSKRAQNKRSCDTSLRRTCSRTYTRTHTYTKALLIFRATLSASVRTFGTHTHTRPRGGRALRFRPRDRRKLADYLKERNLEKRRRAREKNTIVSIAREWRGKSTSLVSPYVKVTASPIVVKSVNLTVAPRLRE